ncbi:MAG: antitoxin Xre/MbcA/ParS toxin-binding domain-containing protein [Pseudomonadota bacterium]
MNIQTDISQFQVRVERIDGLLDRGFSKPEIYKLVAPQRTLGRRKEMLSLEESDRVQRLERVLEHASRVFGTEEKANQWLRRTNRSMNWQVPIDMLVSETGAREVEMQLHAIDHGIYA